MMTLEDYFSLNKGRRGKQRKLRRKRKRKEIDKGEDGQVECEFHSLFDSC